MAREGRRLLRVSSQGAQEGRESRTVEDRPLADNLADRSKTGSSFLVIWST